MLEIGNVKLPLNAVTKTFAILAKRGAGKTYTAAVLAEEFAQNNIPFVVFDPIDVWWGLRLSADGKGKGLPVVVFGKEHADIQITRDDGARIAEAVVRDNISCVISTFGMSKADMRHLIMEFSETLLNINNTPRHVFIEEAHEYLPQKVFGGASRMFAAVEALVVMGRNRGIGVSLINQRAATVNKDVLTQLDTLIALQNTSPQDRKALQGWVEIHNEDEAKFDKFMKSLPSLPKGEGWVWSPEFMDIFDRVKIRKRRTFHPDREKVSKDFEMPRLEQADIQGFISRFVQEKPQEKGSTKPKKGVKQPLVQSNIQGSDAIGMAPSVIQERQIQSVRNEYESQLIQKDAEIRRLQGIINAASAALNGGVAHMAPTLSTPITALSGSLVDSLPSYEKSIMQAIMQHPNIPFSAAQLALKAGKSSKSSAYETAIAKLVRLNLIRREGRELVFRG